ncbi:uncharacterized protein M8220_003610 isoform 3-T3 [Acridotheres tristis]
MLPIQRPCSRSSPVWTDNSNSFKSQFFLLPLQAESKKSSLQGNCRHISTKQQDIQAAKPRMSTGHLEKGIWISHGRTQETVAD